MEKSTYTPEDTNTLELPQTNSDIIQKQNSNELNTPENNSYKCHVCGNVFTLEKSFCPKCGTKKRIYKQPICSECGTALSSGEVFCSKCGKKYTEENATIEKAQDIAKNLKYNKKTKTKILFGAISLSVVIFLIIIGIVLASLLSPQKYLQKADYEKAYSVAFSKDDKKDVSDENIIAHISCDVVEGLKDSSSFVLKDAYIQIEDGIIRVVLHSSGNNSYGARVSSYQYYKFYESDNDFLLYTSVSDFEKEEIYSWDDTEDKLEKVLNNIAKEDIKEITNDKSCKLSKDIVNNINTLFENDLLYDIELLDNVLEECIEISKTESNGDEGDV